MKEYEKLIEESQAILNLNNNNNPSFFDICKHPRSRFEEVSSRILAFYFSPNNPHEYSTMFLEALITVINNKCNSEKFNSFIGTVKIELEKYAFGRRIDIYIESENFVIGIENKINAKLYNKLEDYKNKLDNSGKDSSSIHKVILSVRELDIQEKEKAKKQGFIFISYQEFIDEVNKNELNINNKYSLFWQEFCIEIKKNKHNYMNENELFFFNKNTSKIERLLVGYKKYKNKILSKQKEKIKELTRKISKKTINGEHISKWWNPSTELGYNVTELDKKNNKVHIGLVGKFIANEDNPLAFFEIHIKTFNKRSFDHYEKRLRIVFSDSFQSDENNNYIVFKVIKNNIEDGKGNFEKEIIKNLETAFNLVNGI